MAQIIFFCENYTKYTQKVPVSFIACIKLAAYYTIRRELYGDPEQLTDVAENATTRAYSYAAPPEQVETIIDYQSDTEFSQAIDGRQAADIWPIMDELMTVLQATNPRLYAGVMRKIEN